MSVGATWRMALPALVAAALAWTPPSTARAQAGACGEKRDVKQGVLDEPTYRQLNKAFELVGEERYDEAYESFNRLRGRASSDYLRSILAQAIAQVEWARGNYDAALRDFELAVDLNALPDDTHYALMYQIAQLYYMEERNDEALARLELWFCKVPQDKHQASAYVLKASILSRKEDWEGVVEAIDQAISMSDKPEENWYLLKLAALYELERFRPAAETLQLMVAKWPDKKSYWTQLSNTHYQLDEPAKALSVLSLAHRRGMLDTQSDLLFLANLYANQDVPYKAASVMQTGIEEGVIEPTEKHWTLAGDNWYAAEEYENALAAFERAGSAALDGEIDLRRGFILVDMERWQEARTALESAVEKGGLNDTQMGQAYLMLGMSAFNLGDFDQASANWGRAGRFDNTREAARQWMNHLRDERARQSAAP